MKREFQFAAGLRRCIRSAYLGMHQMPWSRCLSAPAASLPQGRRFSRPKRLNAYRRWVDDFQLLGSVAAAAGGEGSAGGGREEREAAREAGGRAVPGLHLPPETPLDRLLDTVMLRLRLSGGWGGRVG